MVLRLFSLLLLVVLVVVEKEDIVEGRKWFCNGWVWVWGGV